MVRLEKKIKVAGSPRTTPTERRMMKGLLLPRFDLHLSEMEPRIGVQKKPTNGDKHQIRVMCLWRTPRPQKYEKLMHVLCYVR